MGFMQGYLEAQTSVLGNQLKQQMIEENKLKLKKQQDDLNDEAQAKAILTQNANKPVPTSSFQLAQSALPQASAAPSIAPTGLTPQEGLTGLGGMSTPQQAPTGLQPEAELTGLGGMQQADNSTVESPVKEGNLVTKVQDSAKELKVTASRLEQALAVETELRKNGLHDQADKYIEKQYKLESAAESAKVLHLSTVTKAGEHLADLGNSYLEAVKANPAQADAAWARMLMQASSEGFPIDSYLAIPPNQREAAAQQIVDNAETTGQRAKLEQETIRQQGLAKRAADSANLRIKLTSDATKRQADREAGVQHRWEATQDLQLYKTQEANTETNIRNAQRDRDDYDQQIVSVDAKIRDIETGNILTIKKADRPAAIEALRQDRAELANARVRADKDVKAQEEDLTSLHENFKKSGLKEEPTKEPAPAKPAVVDIDAVRAGAAEAIKKGADPAQVAARFKEVTGQEYAAKPGVDSGPTPVTEPAAIKSITTQSQLDKAIKLKLLTAEEIAAAKTKIKSLSASLETEKKTEKKTKLEKQRIDRINLISNLTK